MKRKQRAGAAYAAPVRNVVAKHAPRMGGVHGGGYMAKRPSRAASKARARRDGW